mmetsp:Transcript_7365/g.12379  ORF Transcript_7365/g.12379 Transcript_7365/m.12379 type:complete len:115 (+) Transcript_7365:19-363(+)|eukprot:CAMPEP_0119314304 /NCGR_PEP_ID=MMETSP1333-20130426/32371_1 /TAXON_ID=418940 /ORGANISM="Scyphosphaera apsteinii, Strain RCC1455" /LENGTH=114 /DNA_ID=CAMNT_0007319391 /DNA_START=19 /DNA_END=363 /DNA_ORIENTATION=+
MSGIPVPQGKVAATKHALLDEALKKTNKKAKKAISQDDLSEMVAAHKSKHGKTPVKDAKRNMNKKTKKTGAIVGWAAQGTESHAGMMQDKVVSTVRTRFQEKINSASTSADCNQ